MPYICIYNYDYVIIFLKLLYCHSKNMRLNLKLAVLAYKPCSSGDVNALGTCYYVQCVSNVIGFIYRIANFAEQGIFSMSASCVSNNFFRASINNISY